MSRLNYFCLLFVTLVSVGGCGAGVDPLQRQAVVGNVTLNGEPIEEGSITFQPEAASGETTTGGATATGAVISEGKYEIPKENGLAPGSYRVSISSPEPVPDRSGDDLMNNPGPPRKERVAAKYNSKSELQAKIESGSQNTFDFQVTSE